MKKRAWVGVGIATMFAAAALQLSAAVPQQTQTCASSPRRSDAVKLARGINTAEAAAYSKNKAYQPLDALGGITVPAGFTVQVVTNSSGYIFTIKDEQDVCGFGLFSDQIGVIYLGESMK